MLLMLKKLWALFWSYSDVTVALIAAVAITGLSAADKLGRNAQGAATLGVLAAVAFSLLHDRRARERLKSDVVDEMLRLERALTSHFAYETTNLGVTWDLTPPSGATAELTRQRTIKFFQNDAAVIYEWAGSDSGSVEQKEIMGGSSGAGNLHILTRLDSPITDPEGNQLHIVSLDRLAQAGEEWVIEDSCTFHDCFTGSEEWVIQTIKFPTRKLSIEIKWPTGREPSGRLRIDRNKGFPRQEFVAVRRTHGRLTHRYEVDGPITGEVFKLTWSW